MTTRPIDPEPEGPSRPPATPLGVATRIVAVALALFDVWAVLFSTLDPYLHRALFTASMLGLSFMWTAATARTAWARARDLAWAIASLGGGLYLFLRFDWLSWRWPLVHPLGAAEIAVALVLVAAVFEITRRLVGWAMCAAILVFLAYAVGGHLVGGLFHHRPLAVAEILDHLVFTTNGLFGAPIAVAATYVFFFVLFGTALELSGGSELFFRLAEALAGRARGGTAKVALVSSALYGTVTGSPTSNVVTTGTFTIPLMKRSGFSAEVAGAVEAVASTGGSLMPPVMGSAAFLMAEFTGIAYGDIVVAAALPALLFYFGVFMQVHFRAVRMNAVGPPPGDVSLARLMRERGLHLVPLLTLVALLISGRTAIHAAAVALVLTILVSWLRPETRMGPRALLEMLELSAYRSVLVAVACAAAGMLVGAIAATGMAGKITSLIVASSGGSLLAALVLTMAVCVLLGMGMPIPSAYVLTAVLAGPPLAVLGLTTMSAHLFIVYFAVLSAITPPVAVAAYAAAGIAQASPNRVAVQSMRLGLVAFVVPYFFVYQPALLLRGSVWVVGGALISSVVGVLFVAGALEGFVRQRLGRAERVVLLAAGLCLIFPGWRTDLAGAVLGLLALRGQILPRRPPAGSAAEAAAAGDRRSKGEAGGDVG